MPDPFPALISVDNVQVMTFTQFLQRAGVHHTGFDPAAFPSARYWHRITVGVFLDVNQLNGLRLYIRVGYGWFPNEWSVDRVRAALHSRYSTSFVLEHDSDPAHFAVSRALAT